MAASTPARGHRGQQIQEQPPYDGESQPGMGAPGTGLRGTPASGFLSRR